MDKLLKLKEWHTLEGAAARLSKKIGEDVSPSDILQLCYERRLKLSLLLRRERFVEEYSYCPLPDDGFYRFSALFELKFKIYEIDEDKQNIITEKAKELFNNKQPPYVSNEISEVIYLDGVYEIDINGIEDKLLAVILRQESELINIDGWSVLGVDGAVYRNRVGVLYDEFDEEQLESMNMKSKPREYYPTDVLPSLEQFVIQTLHLIEFEQSLQAGQEQQAKLQFKTVQFRREKVLSELIKQHGKAELILLGRLGVWQELTKMDGSLFPARDNTGDSTVKKFFDNQKLIAFKRGR